jgi:hypothetical protein
MIKQMEKKKKEKEEMIKRMEKEKKEKEEAMKEKEKEKKEKEEMIKRMEKEKKEKEEAVREKEKEKKEKEAMIKQMEKEKKEKEDISIILGLFYAYIEIPEEERIIVYTLINCIKKTSTNKLTKKEDIDHFVNILGALINISVNYEKNRKIIIDNGIIPLLLPLINSSETLVFENSVILLSNLCAIELTEIKNKIIELGAFNILHKKLLEISLLPPQKTLSSNYYSIYRSVAAIDNLLDSNSSGVTSFLNTPLIPLLLWTLNSAIFLADTSSDTNIHNIQNGICRCFMDSSFFSYEDSSRLIEMKVIDGMMNVIETYASEIKENKQKQKVNEDTCLRASIVIFNISFHGFNKLSSGEFNKFKLTFGENNKIIRLFDSFKIIVSHQPQSPTQKEILDIISISICRLLKLQKLSPIYHPVLIYLNKVRSSPSPITGYNFPLQAQIAWNEMVDAEKCL